MTLSLPLKVTYMIGQVNNVIYDIYGGFPGGSDGKESACYAGDLGSIPGLRRSSGEGKGTYSSILAWRIPWTVESMGLQRIR